MRHIQKGGRVSVDLEDWINKSLGRTPVRVYTYDEEGVESPAINWFQFYVGYGMKELAEKLFPWAVASVDEEFYDENSDMDRDSDQLSLAGDDEDGPADDRDPSAVYPYSESSGEVEHYRLKLELNELGEAFLKVSDHLSAAD
jgi:hypothetical protein